MEEQMKKGILEMCILFFISREDLYGYEIMKKMECYHVVSNESTFYAILRRLKKEGYAETYIGAISQGPVRKYYKITQNGKAYLKKSIEDWTGIVEMVENIGIKKTDI